MKRTLSLWQVKGFQEDHEKDMILTGSLDSCMWRLPPNVLPLATHWSIGPQRTAVRKKPAMTHSFLKIMSKSTLPFVRSQWHHQIRREKIVVLRCAEQVLECRQTLVSFCGIILYTADLDSS